MHARTNTTVLTALIIAWAFLLIVAAYFSALWAERPFTTGSVVGSIKYQGCEKKLREADGSARAEGEIFYSAKLTTWGWQYLTTRRTILLKITSVQNSRECVPSVERCEALVRRALHSIPGVEYTVLEDNATSKFDKRYHIATFIFGFVSAPMLLFWVCTAICIAVVRSNLKQATAAAD